MSQLDIANKLGISRQVFLRYFLFNQIKASDECLDLVEQRKRYKLTNKTMYRRLNQKVRHQLKTGREAYWNNIAAKVEEAAHRHEYRTLYSTLRRLNGKVGSVNDNIRKFQVAGIFSEFHIKLNTE